MNTRLALMPDQFTELRLDTLRPSSETCIPMAARFAGLAAREGKRSRAIMDWGGVQSGENFKLVI